MRGCCAVDHVDTEQIVAGLRQQGFDARTFNEADTYRGVAIHCVSVLGWRYPDGRWEFTDRPARLIEPDANDPTGRWIWDDIFSDYCQPTASVFDPAHTIIKRVAELLSTEPNRPRSQCFSDFWAWDRACLDSSEAPEAWYHDWSDHLFAELRPVAAKAGYTPHTARLADHMCSPRALTTFAQDDPAPADGHRVYRLAPDVPLAAPLLDRLRNIRVRNDFSTWAQIGRTSDPVDWPALIAELGQYLGWDNEQLPDSGRTANPEQPAHCEVALRVGPDGRILVSRAAILTPVPNNQGAQQ